MQFCTMKTVPFTPDFFTGNRNRLAGLLKIQSLAVVNSNDVLPTNADGTFPFKQHNDLYYLTGIRQEETLLVLFPDARHAWQKEVLFILRPDEVRTKWEGHKLSQQEASAISGIKEVRYIDEFLSFFKQVVFDAANIYLNANEHSRAKVSIQTRDDRFRNWCRENYGLHQYERLAPLMALLRIKKQDEEIAVMKHAAYITEQGFKRVLKFVKPGVHQKQAEAEMIHEYLQHHATWADYQPIVASGADTCILHYNSNHKHIGAGELVLIDAAASYIGYQSDLTRTIPADGRYTGRQKQLYEAVLYVHREMKKLVKPGVLMEVLQEQCNELLLEQLVGLSLCTGNDIRGSNKQALLDKYCYHRFSHLIGLDVHDVGDYSQPLEAGWVCTNEPGIYIQEEAMGVRIENNLLLTPDGNTDLMESIPVEVKEIEYLMNR